jgi:pentose-5-phosphate-3-epimerase
MIILHYESDANFHEIADILKSNHIKFGIALLQQTETAVLAQFKDIVDHVLIFSGNLGYFGGNVDMGLIEKVKEVKALNSKIEIGWDGGVNLSNAKYLVKNSVDVLNVGGYIHKSADPKEAYILLVESLEASR